MAWVFEVVRLVGVIRMVRVVRGVGAERKVIVVGVVRMVREVVVLRVRSGQNGCSRWSGWLE